MKRKIFIIGLFFLCLSISAHEFWLEADTFFFAKDTVSHVLLRVGEDFDGKPWRGTITELVLWGKSGSTPLAKQIDTTERSIKIVWNKEGYQLLTLQNKASKIVLEAKKFNAYLKEDGLLEVLAYRKKNNLEKKEGREIYQRCAKMLVLVGKKDKSDKTYQQNCGLPLEIIPLKNPLSRPKVLHFVVLFEGKPAQNLSIRLWQKTKKGLIKDQKTTDANGEVSFAYKPQGKMMISTVIMTPHHKPEEADWHSYWASLVFGWEK